MKRWSETAIGRLRAIGFIEGISYIVLVGIAVPLKRFAGIPEAVKYVGWAHGILFILFVLALAQVYFQNKWSIQKAFLAFVSSLIPFGTFVLDHYLKKEEQGQADSIA